MEVQAHNDNGKVTLQLIGRLDTAVAKQVQEDINNTLLYIGDIENLTIDASKLEYISSTGLRIVLALKKKYPSTSVIEVTKDVYEVFNITGFTKIIDVKKAFRVLNIDGYKEIGRGGIGIVYRISDDTIVKVFREGTTLDEVSTEINMSKETFLLGMPTAISYDIVKVGSQYGLVYELLNSKNLSTIICEHPENIDTYSRQMAELYHTLHNIHIDEGTIIPNAHKIDENRINIVKKYYDPKDIDKLLYILHSIPQGHSLLHCDLHAKNVMVQNGEFMVIDMGEVGYGNPMIDLAHAHSTHVAHDVESFMGIPRALINEFGDKTLEYYFKDKSSGDIEIIKKKLNVAYLVRNFTWLSLSDSFSEELIHHSQEEIKIKLTAHWEEIKQICDEGLSF